MKSSPGLTARSALARMGPQLLAVGLITVGLGACYSVVRIDRPTRQFDKVQVIAAFPARIDTDATGGTTVTRVCGALDQGLQANAVEFTFNLVSTKLEPETVACEENDKDQSVMEGELIGTFPVVASDAQPTVGEANFQLTLGCLDDYAPAVAGAGAPSCTSAIQSITLNGAQDVRYRQFTKPSKSASSGRCDPSDLGTRINVAVLADLSGSNTGLVDVNGKEYPTDQASTADPQPSDPNASRIKVLQEFVRNDLNRGHDRVVGFAFGNGEVDVLGSDQLGCIGGTVAPGTQCLVDDDCGSGGLCRPDASKQNTFELLAENEALDQLFGPKDENIIYLDTALRARQFEAKGRAPTFAAIDKAFGFLRDSPVGGAKAIVLITDGPDTCTETEDFLYTSPEGKCRLPCQNIIQSEQNFQAVRQKVVEHFNLTGDWIPVHIIQFQSAGYAQPDARMMELACESNGTFQFINSSQIPSEQNLLETTLQRALQRVRFALAGNWRVAFRVSAIEGGQVPVGTMQAMRGQLEFRNSSFPELDGRVYLENDEWRFSVRDNNEDRRLLMRVPCMSTADCGGAECGADACLPSGLCASNAQPDLMPCSTTPNGKCCSGVCSADCQGACTN